MKVIQLIDGSVAKVDDEDYDLISRHRWRPFRPGNRGITYAKTTIGATTITMHRLVFGNTEQLVDHENRDGLDNQKYNLRAATQGQNQGNRETQKHSSKFKGVCYVKARSKWVANIGSSRSKNNKYLGAFDREEDAAKAYDSAAIKFFGEFARTNKQMGVL